MGRSPCCDESGLKKGPWTPEEDDILVKYIMKHGHGSWRALPKLAGTHLLSSSFWTVCSMSESSSLIAHWAGQSLMCSDYTWSHLMMFELILQVLIGAGRVADWDGRTTWGPTSREGSSRRRKRTRFSVSMQSLATSNRPYSVILPLWNIAFLFCSSSLCLVN